jgi:uncharacterized paraquat-inducible protein A
MKLRPCKDCGYTIGQSAAYCPRCGAKNPRQAPLIVVLAFAALVVSMFYSGCQKEMEKRGYTSSASM